MPPLAPSLERDIKRLSGDRALFEPKDDRLEYAPLAEYLANSIQRMSPPDGFVVAIHGEWGSGKTSLLNLFQFYIQQSEPAPILVHFNPWWFAGQDLTRRFFRELGSTLNKSGQTVSQALTDLSEILADSSTIGGKILGRSLARSTEDARNELKEKLRKFDRRIVVMVDDIDRLTKTEVRQLFQVIKALGDLPNIVYILAFDRTYVSEALKEVQDRPGHEYLEKIVQVSFDLPRADRNGLRSLLNEKLDALIEETPPGVFDQTYWGNLFLGGIEHMMKTPRDVVRLVNGLTLFYPKVGAEINFTDFVALEALRLNFPSLYYLIRDNKDSFAGTGDNHGLGLTEPERLRLRALHDSWVAELPVEDAEAIKDLVKRMFPRLERIWGNTFYGSTSEGIWRRDCRIASPDMFPLYFQMAVPTGAISHTEIQAFLSMAKNPDAMAAELVRLAGERSLAGGSKAKALLAILEDYTSNIPIDDIPGIIEGILQAGDDVLPSEPEPPGTWIRTELQVERILYQLCVRLPDNRRFEVIVRAMQRSTGITLAVHFVQLLSDLITDREGRPREPQRMLLNNSQLDELKVVVKRRLAEAAAEGKLIALPDLAYVLHRWWEWDGEADARNWVGSVAKDDDELVKLLESFGQYTTSQSGDDKVSTKHYRLNPKSFSRFIEPAELAKRVKALTGENEAVKRFLLEWDALERGEDPDDFRWRRDHS